MVFFGQFKNRKKKNEEKEREGVSGASPVFTHSTTKRSVACSSSISPTSTSFPLSALARPCCLPPMQPRTVAADEEQQQHAAAAPIAADALRYSSFGLSKNPSAAAAVAQPQQPQQQKQQKQSRLNKALRTGPAPWSVAAPGRASGAVAGA